MHRTCQPIQLETCIAPPLGLTRRVVLTLADRIEPPKSLGQATLFYPSESRSKKDDDKDDTPMYHSKAHLPTNDEGLLIDPGAFDNLVGDAWVERQGTIAKEHGFEPSFYDLPKVMRVQGVGKEAQETTKAVRMPGQLETGQSLQYTAPVIPRWGGPALCGLKSLAANDAIMDCRTPEQKLYLGADTKIVPGPGTTTLQLYPAMSGHLMLPISRFDSKAKKGTMHMHASSSSGTDERPTEPRARSMEPQARPALASQSSAGRSHSASGR